jgi:hypothetical protein
MMGTSNQKSKFWRVRRFLDGVVGSFSIEKSKGYNSAYSAFARLNNFLYYWRNTFILVTFFTFSGHITLSSGKAASQDFGLFLAHYFVDYWTTNLLRVELHQPSLWKRRNFENTNSAILYGPLVIFHRKQLILPIKLYFFQQKTLLCILIKKSETENT